MKKILSTFLLFALCLCFACQPDPTKPATKKTVASKPNKPKVKVDVPNFDEENAYAMIAKQVAFGPRVPGTDEHAECAKWLKSELELSADKVEIQISKTKVPDGKTVPIKNIIAAFKPEAKKRILLCAHWDTRPWADQDGERQEEPIDGANDGGSGVGILLEIAKQLKNKPLDLGVDIVLFDVEDYGKSEVADSYCLGSQYWGKQAKASGYSAEYGILLDMVGAENALFYQESYSKSFAQHILDKVWKAGNDAGYSSYFIHRKAPPVTDDHRYVHYYTGIPIIDIIQFDNQGKFGEFWHTHEDDMDIISKRTLKAVGQTVLQVLYQDNAAL